MNVMIPFKDTPPKRPRGKWVVDVKGGAEKVFEISVLRNDNHHGKQSYGWMGKDKRYISGSGGPCRYVVSPAVWKALLKIAAEEAERLNREEP